MPDRPPIVVVGDACADVVVRLAGRFVPGSDTGARIAMRPGGSGANVAAWLASLGTAVAFVGRVGADDAGDRQRASLTAVGVDVRLTVDRGRPTGTVVAVVDAAGERSMLTDRAASAALAPRDLPDDCWMPGGHLHLSGYTLLHADSREAGLAALARARGARMTVSVDPSSHEPLRAVGARAFLGWTAGADLCLPNLDEAQVLADRDEIDAVLAMLATTYRAVALTLGAWGARWAGVGGAASVEAVPGPVVDTTGAGDAFCAGALASWLAGNEAEAVLRTGAQLAARAVAQVGARPRPGE